MTHISKLLAQTYAGALIANCLPSLVSAWKCDKELTDQSLSFLLTVFKHSRIRPMHAKSVRKLLSRESPTLRESTMRQTALTSANGTAFATPAHRRASINHALELTPTLTYTTNIP
jgi:hypothetical protein